jgi:hypothetical protein
VEVYNLYGTADVDVDVTGYYTGVGGIGSDFTPLAAPVRVADTRTASLIGTETAIGAAASESFSLATAASGIPATAAAVAANVTVVSGATSGYLSIYPAPAATTQPAFSDMNWVANDIVQNFSIAPTNGTGSVEIYNSYGTVDVVADVFGYFTTVTEGPIMVSAVVTPTTITITYNEGVSCPAAGADAAFVYDWTGAASGGTVTGCSTSTTNADALVLAASGGFTLPGSTGGSITYTAGAGRSTPVTDTDSISVFATASTSSFSPTQTLALTAAPAPVMVSAYTTATTLVITYNEAVSCTPNTTVAADFTYNYSGIASGFTNGTLADVGDDVVTAACSGTTVTLTETATAGTPVVEAPLAGANVVYTPQPSTVTPSAANSVLATGSVPTLYGAAQTLTVWTPPAITAAVVTPGATGSILVTYTTVATMACGTAIQSEFVYSNVGSPAYPSVCTAHANNTLTLSAFMTTAAGTTAATLSLPGATDTLVYTSPAAPAVATEVHATNVFPQFPATQTFVLGAAAVPAMLTGAASATVLPGSIAITYSEAVTCPATGADADFVYYYQGASIGGVATGCSTAGAVLTLTGAFAVAAASATIVYTAPAASTTSNAVSATGTTTDFAATQTIGPAAGVIVN